MGIPSSNVQYHPPRLSENQLNLPQPHSPSLPTHCSGKSGMRPVQLHASLPSSSTHQRSERPDSVPIHSCGHTAHAAPRACARIAEWCLLCFALLRVAQEAAMSCPDPDSGHVAPTDRADGAIPGVRHEQDQGGALPTWHRGCESRVSTSTCVGHDVVTESRHLSAELRLLVHGFTWPRSSVRGAFAENESVGCSRSASRHHRIRRVARRQQFNWSVGGKLCKYRLP